MATTIKKTLQLNFLNGEQDPSRITLTDMKEDLSADTVTAAMKVISESGVFDKEGVAIYATPKSAKYIERHVTPIYEAPEAE